MFIIAGAVMPVPTRCGDHALPVPPPDPCGACERCRSACPVGAIDRPGNVRNDLCLQGKAGCIEGLDEKVMALWGARLYGCQDCQAACPHNSRLNEAAPASTGEIGPGISLHAFLSEDDEKRKRRFKGTALGMSWVNPDALLRNALVAAGNRGDASLRGGVERHIARGPDPVREAARWALERL
jgi:epoxyqueuosine reductase